MSAEYNGASEAAAALERRLRHGPPLILDGATGTELERLGVETGLPLWSTHALLHAPDAVRRIHRAYREAGSEIVTANTFRTQRRTLARAGLGDRDAELTRLAVDLAREAGHRGWVAGSAPTLEDCYRPDLVPEPDALAEEHARHAANLAEAGVDLVLAETLNTVRETTAACTAARRVGLPCWASFVCGRGATLLSGEPLAEAVAAAVSCDAVAVLVNCVPPSRVADCLGDLARSGRPFGVYANLGEPDGESGSGRTEDCSPERFARHAEGWIAAGARIVGGCCGTSPAHIAAIARNRSA